MASCVQRTSELRRIEALPRRTWDAGAPALADRLTSFLTIPGHKCKPGCAELNGVSVVKLRPWQAQGLAEFHDHAGHFTQAGVGEGKTLVSMLAPVMMCADRALVLVPKNLEDDTIRKFNVLRQHWQYLPTVVRGYEFISNEKNVDFLRTFFKGAKRGVLFLDEADRLKNFEAKRTNLVANFIEERRKEERQSGVRNLFVYATSGTTANRSILECAHLQHWALPWAGPLPVEESDLLQWSAAVDEKVIDQARLDPGALMVFADPKDPSDKITAARRGVQKRMFETPGVMSVPTTALEPKLRVTLVELPLSKVEDDAFSCLRSVECETPDGHPIADAVSLWRHARELALGFYYRWDPRPPEPWLVARREWCAAVRDILSNNGRELYTELQVANEVRLAVYGRKCPTCKRRTTAKVCRGVEEQVDTGEEGHDGPIYRTEGSHAEVETIAAPKHHEASHAYEAWHAVRDTFVPNTVPVWIGDSALRYATEWTRRSVGIVWTEHRAFAEKLAELSGLPFYGRGGLDGGGRPIESADPKKSLIASIASNHVGRNLQAWSQSLVTSCPPTGRIVEQMIGREHRPGQRNDVHYEFLIGCREQLAGFEQAKRDCVFHRDTLGFSPKLSIAEIVTPRWKAKGEAWKAPLKGSDKKRAVMTAIEKLRPTG